MEFKIYNTRSRKIEVFKPISSVVKIYVCGPTVYDDIHVGNARVYVLVDIICRFLKLFYKVFYVRNITDVDDNISEKSSYRGYSLGQFVIGMICCFRREMYNLGNISPNVEPRVTDHILEIIDFIKLLLFNGFAYANNGCVFFNVSKFNLYGTYLTNRFYLINDSDFIGYKLDDRDFVLWKSSDFDKPGWISPWGYGRPGWHVECSVMCLRYLGEKIDFHIGGQDLIFPHHENEIVQIIGIGNVAILANYWIHVAMVMFNNEKMSKSLNNFLSVYDLASKFGYDAVRLFLLMTHYRRPLICTEENVRCARVILDYIYFALRGYACDGSESSSFDKVVSFLSSDLNVPALISYLYSLACSICKGNDIRRKKFLQKILYVNISFLGFLGILGSDVNLNYFDDKYISMLVLDRTRFRFNKDFIKSDVIRDFLFKRGILIQDFLI